jgi:acyl carrier protein
MRKTAPSTQSDVSIDGRTVSRLAAVFCDVLTVPLDGVHPDLGPAEVERWDSVGHVMLVAAIEQEFSIQFEVDEIMEFTSFGAILSAIEQRMAA